MQFQRLTTKPPCPDEGAPLLHLAPSKPLFYQTMTGNKFRRASVNHKTMNIVARPSPATIRLPGEQDFAPRRAVNPPDVSLFRIGITPC